jgi:hypothetical protein
MVELWNGYEQGEEGGVEEEGEGFGWEPWWMAVEEGGGNREEKLRVQWRGTTRRGVKILEI